MAEAKSDAASDVHPTRDILGRVPIKRARPQLSCTPCRQGKLKCNREHPICDQCAKRSRHNACAYLPPPPRNKQAQNMRGRIRNLESLVVNLMKQKEQGNGDRRPEAVTGKEMKDSEAVDLEPMAESFGRLHVGHDGLQTNYTAPGHWSSLLKEIEEVKVSLEQDDDASDDQEGEWDDSSARSTVTFGIPKPVTRAQLLQEMPPKDEVDRLLPLWFNSADPLLYILHGPTFQEEYNQFWRDTSTASIMWIGLLYSALALGIILGPRNPGMNTTTNYPQGVGIDEPDRLINVTNKFQQLASSAIVLADVAKSQPYTLETLMIYGECEFLRRDDNCSKIWLMNGLTLRVAMRMGYHRDPSNFNTITPFQGEMRRRTWHVLNMMDTLISFTVGLPTSLRSLESDVRAPQNLYDHDIASDMTQLPKGRPQAEITSATYTIAKSRVCRIFGEAAELLHRINPPKHSEIMELHKRLRQAHNLIPKGMRIRSMDDSITDSPVMIMSRFNIELMYQKTRIVLHRSFFTAGQIDSRFTESRKICTDAAITILNYQKIIVHACSPGGQLNKVWWYMSSLTTYDFLLAAMILCLELNHLQNKDSVSVEIPKLRDILNDTVSIWSKNPSQFKAFTRGTEMLETMLKRSPSDDADIIFAKATFNTAEEIDMSSTAPLIEMTPPEQIWGAWWQAGAQSHETLDIPSEVDWNLWDSTVQGQTNILPQQSDFHELDMDLWMGVGTSVASNTTISNDFRDSLAKYTSNHFVPAEEEHNIGLFR